MTEVRPSISVLVPTIDPKRPLAGLIKSFLSQASDGDKLFIGIDKNHDAPNDQRLIEHTVLSFMSLLVKAIVFDIGHHCWGHCIMNGLLQRAHGDYLVFIDDDDTLVPDALSKIRATAIKHGFQLMSCPKCGETIPAGAIPFLFKTKMWNRTDCYWFSKDVRHGGVGAHCLVVPNVKDRLGNWTCRYEGDYDFVDSTLKKWGTFEWVDEVIMNIRVTGDYRRFGP